MIKIIEGNLFDSKARFICHQVNCQSRMSSGVALQVKERFPHVYNEYIKICSPYMLGKIQLVPCNAEYIGQDIVPVNEPYICNLFAQDKYGYDGKQYTSLDALSSCFKQISDIASKCGGTIAMPYMIGCCRGGADWNVVHKMIEEIFSHNDVELWRYKN